MDILLDTHVALWAIADSGRLPEEAASLVSDARNSVFYSIVSVWEVAIKHAIRPENLPVPEEDFVDLCERTGFRQLPLTARQVYHVKSLLQPEVRPHRDPFDNLLLAQAKAEGLRFMTHDGKIAAFAEPCILEI